jgi:hypothetical protein
VRHHLTCLARLSESLRMRPDLGQQPALIGRADMGTFLREALHCTIGYVPPVEYEPAHYGALTPQAQPA